jgi:hypothetical protein
MTKSKHKEGCGLAAAVFLLGRAHEVLPVNAPTGGKSRSAAVTGRYAGLLHLVFRIIPQVIGSCQVEILGVVFCTLSRANSPK